MDAASVIDARQSEMLAVASAARRTSIDIAHSLLLSCLRWPLDAQARDEIRRLSIGVDWEVLVKLAARHRVDALVENALRSAQVVLTEVMQSVLSARARTASVGELTISAETVRVGQKLLDEGIPFRVLKGATVALAAYGRAGLRFSRDVDLLVEPRAAAAALDCLRRAGYRPVEDGFKLSKQYQRRFKDVELVHETSQLTVELHWRLFDNRWLMREPFAHDSATIEYARWPIPAFHADYAFRYLCLHGAHHAWSRLKWIADINALLAHIDDIEAVYRDATGLGERRAVGQALLLCHHLFGTEIPELVRAEARPGSSLDRLLKAALAASLGTGAEEIEDLKGATLGKNLSHYALSRDPRYLLSEIWFDINDDRGLRDRRFGPFGRVVNWIHRRYLGGAGTSHAAL